MKSIALFSFALALLGVLDARAGSTSGTLSQGFTVVPTYDGAAGHGTWSASCGGVSSVQSDGAHYSITYSVTVTDNANAEIGQWVFNAATDQPIQFYPFQNGTQLGAGTSSGLQGIVVAPGTYVKIIGDAVNSAGGAASISNYFRLDADVGQYKVIVSAPANNSDRAVRYDVVQGGSTITSFSSSPGSGAIIQEISVPSTDPVYVHGIVIGIAKDGVSWYESPGLETQVSNSGPITPKQNPARPADEFNIPSIDMPKINGLSPTNGVWDKSTDGTNGAGGAQTDLLTNKTYKQGIDAVNGNIKDGNNKLDTIKSTLETINKRTVDMITGKAELVAAAEASGAALKTAAETAAKGVVETMPSVASTSDIPHSVASSVYSLGTVTAPTKNITLALDPSILFPNFESGMLACREGFLWGMAIAFFIVVQAKLDKYVTAIFQVQQASTQEETSQVIVPGVGIIKQGALCIIVGGVILGFVTSIILAGNTNLPQILSTWSWSNVHAVNGMVTAGSYGAKAYNIVNTFFPVVASVELVLAYLVFGWNIQALYLVSALVLKYVRF